MEFPRQESWSGLLFPFPRDLPDPGMELVSLASFLHCSQVLYHWVTGEAPKSGFTRDAAHHGNPRMQGFFQLGYLQAMARLQRASSQNSFIWRSQITVEHAGENLGKHLDCWRLPGAITQGSSFHMVCVLPLNWTTVSSLHTNKFCSESTFVSPTKLAWVSRPQSAT